jgi:hypothetical protein
VLRDNYPDALAHGDGAKDWSAISALHYDAPGSTAGAIVAMRDLVFHVVPVAAESVRMP